MVIVCLVGYWEEGGKETISDETGFLFSLHFVYSYDFAFFNFCCLHVTIFVARSIFLFDLKTILR